MFTKFSEEKVYNFFQIVISLIFICLSVNNQAFAEDSSMVPGAVATIGIYSAQQNTYRQSFERIDAFMSLPQDERILMRYNNKIAYTGAGQQVFSPTFIPDEKAGIWIKNYTLFEDIYVGNGSNISNVGYGAILGYDTDLKHLKNGFDSTITLHASYGGARENVNQLTSMDEVGSAGITGALFKNHFFTAVTVAAGGAYTRENSTKGMSNFNTLLAGAAWKTGYNFEFKKGKYILQPSFVATYSFDKLFDFRTADGKNVTVDHLHVVQIVPEVKLIGNFKGNLQPYLSFNYVWNLMDSPAIYINNELQPRMTIGPYCEYGFGVQKKWKDKYIGFGQILMRGGSRNGASLFFGLRMALGKK